MNSSWKAFAYIMSVNFQAGLLLYVSIKGASYLNTYYPLNFSWQKITLPLGVITIFYLYYKVLLAIDRFSKK